ncbi:alpha-amylase [Roseateles sp. NT4]|uniref:alpha-amylase n=1 Tax=Roseateles sp. NT4 TaxID=3453715 RepID=UPI003EEE6A5A
MPSTTFSSAPRAFPRRTRLTLAMGLVLLCASAKAYTNGTMLQYFDWDTSSDGQQWNRIKAAAPTLASKGITAFWLPPAYKGAYGSTDVGYGVYDLFDLGEFNQKGSVRTKYGTRAEYIAAIDAIHAAGAQAYADIVLNHKMGGDATESIKAVRVDPANRNTELPPDVSITAWTSFAFAGRKQADGTLKYNNFQWHWNHFNGIDYAQNLAPDGCASGVNCRIYKFRGTNGWNSNVSTEYGNYDYLLGANIDFANTTVRSHLKDWGVWYTNTAKLDGFRIDAAKHISSDFFNEWLYHVRSMTAKPNAFAVAEYLTWDVTELNNFVNAVNDNANNKMSAFDVPLHFKFYDAASGKGSYDMRNLLPSTLTALQPLRSVTFVDNHDTLTGRGYASQVADWFKPQAYSFILLRSGGYPAVFIGDYEGVSGKVVSHAWVIDQMLKARKFHAYGTQYDYFDNADVVGWTRVGDSEHRYGVAVLMNDNQTTQGSKRMFVGTAHANQCFYDVTNATTTQVCADASGYATFIAPAAKATVWVRVGKFGLNT